MTAMTAFQSAYHQVSQAERSFIDQLVQALADAARRLGQRVSLALGRPIPPEWIERDSKGFLHRPLVRAAIAERITALAVEEEISPDSWIRQVHAIAHFNLRDILTYDEAGDPVIDLDGATREQMSAIRSVEVEKSDGLTRSTKVKIKITTHDKIAALKMEAAYMGLDTGDNPTWQRDKATQAPQLPHDASTETVADTYALMVDGG